MKRLKNYLKLGVFLFGIALTLTNCQKDDTIDFVTEEQSKISIKRITLKEGKQDIALKNMLNDIEQKQHIQSRTVMENEYNFTIVEHDVNVLMKDGYTSYTMLIERPGQDDQYFENLVVEVIPDEETKAYIVKYMLNNIDYTDVHNSYNFEGDVEITPINYDNTLARETCIEVTILYCDNGLQGGDGQEHIAGENCTRQEHLYEKTIKECWEDVASTSPFDQTNGTPGGSSSNSGGSPSGGGGGGNNVDGDDPSNDEGIVVVDEPVKVKGGVNTAPVFVEPPYQIINNVPDDKPCQKEIVDLSIDNNSEISQDIKAFYGNDQNVFNYTIDVGQLGATATGATTPLLNCNPTSCSVSTTLDTDLINNATDIQLAVTTIHESVHAVLAFIFNINPIMESYFPNGESPSDASLHLLALAYTQHQAEQSPISNATLDEAQHIYMTNLVEEIAQAVQAVCLQIGYEQTDPEIQLDKLKELVWAGSLQETDNFYEEFDTFEERERILAQGIASVTGQVVPYIVPDINDPTNPNGMTLYANPVGRNINSSEPCF